MIPLELKKTFTHTGPAFHEHLRDIAIVVSWKFLECLIKSRVSGFNFTAICSLCVLSFQNLSLLGST